MAEIFFILFSKVKWYYLVLINLNYNFYFFILFKNLNNTNSFLWNLDLIRYFASVFFYTGEETGNEERRGMRNEIQQMSPSGLKLGMLWLHGQRLDPEATRTLTLSSCLLSLQQLTVSRKKEMYTSQ